jgi:hypothetical protein
MKTKIFAKPPLNLEYHLSMLNINQVMTAEKIVTVNFFGGIISPGDLYNMLIAGSRAHCKSVRFGLRQQLMFPVNKRYVEQLMSDFTELGYASEVNKELYPNVLSSYPAEDIFIQNTWLSEGVYRDILDAFDYRPKLKINISDSNQSFTPMLTGNINWVASRTAIHYWHLFIRFPKTNTIFEWDQLVYTNDIPRLSQQIEMIILDRKLKLSDQDTSSGQLLFSMLDLKKYILKASPSPAVLPAFNLPYYEGLNRYNSKYWLGIYRRDEIFSVEFLKDLCLLCLETRIGQICSTPWKSLIIKGIEEKDKISWNRLLEKFQVNVRHAANELNFQVEDESPSGLLLKNYLVKQLNNEDIRTFGICFGIKTRRKSEVFSSILIKRRPLFTILGFGFVPLYDILCAQDFNPNKRTASYFSRNNPKFLLGEQLRRAVLSYYHSRMISESVVRKPESKISEPQKYLRRGIYQCKNCLTVYQPELHSQISPDHVCELCEAPSADFALMD